MTDFHSSHDTSPLDIHLAPRAFAHPDDVLDDPGLSIQEKRALLACWASDAHAVPHVPLLRQLPDGSIIKVEDILRALKKLDGGDEIGIDDRGRTPICRQSFARRRRFDLRKWSRYYGRSDDDDDPPPSPADAAIRPRSGGGAAFACPEPVAA